MTSTLKSAALAVVLCASASACSSEPAPSTTPSPSGGQAGQSSGSAGTGGSSGAAGSAGTTGGGSGGGAGAQGGSAGTGGSGGAAGGGGSGGLPPEPVCPEGPFAAPQAGTSTDVCGDFDYAHGYNEGPTWVEAQGAFYFSNFVQGAAGGDLSGDIIKYTPGGGCERVFEDVGTNGLAVSADGNLLGASHKTRSISKFDLSTKEITVVADRYMEQLLDSPNDLVEHSNGGIYFTNPVYELGGRPQGVGPALFWRAPGGTLTLLEQGVMNGIALSPDETRLYVVNGGAFDLAADGTPGENSDFPLSADGLAVDCAGNVYLSGGSIRDPDGNEIGTFPGGTNLAFGGADRKTLFVVGGGTGAHVVPMNVPGLP